jgi:DNA-directed RNA polymerase subunit RPC12/RpoP
MALENYDCFPCGKGFKWEQMVATPAGNLFCPDCAPLLNPQNEPIRKCVVDGSDMKKQLVEDLFIIDRCPSCGGVWLDKGELEIIEKKAKDEGWRRGSVGGIVALLNQP